MQERGLPKEERIQECVCARERAVKLVGMLRRRFRERDTRMRVRKGEGYSEIWRGSMLINVVWFTMQIYSIHLNVIDCAPAI